MNNNFSTFLFFNNSDILLLSMLVIYLQNFITPIFISPFSKTYHGGFSHPLNQTCPELISSLRPGSSQPSPSSLIFHPSAKQIINECSHHKEEKRNYKFIEFRGEGSFEEPRLAKKKWRESECGGEKNKDEENNIKVPVM